jgi:hypothetical protein
LCSGLLAAMPRCQRVTWHVVIYNDGEYILVIKCIGYK